MLRQLREPGPQDLEVDVLDAVAADPHREAEQLDQVCPVGAHRVGGPALFEPQVRLEIRQHLSGGGWQLDLCHDTTVDPLPLPLKHR